MTKHHSTRTALTWPPLRRLAKISRIGIRRLLNRDFHLNIPIQVRGDFGIQKTALVQLRVSFIVKLVVALWSAALLAKGLGKAAAESLQAAGGLFAHMASFNLRDVAGLVVRCLRA